MALCNLGQLLVDSFTEVAQQKSFTNSHLFEFLNQMHVVLNPPKNRNKRKQH